MFCMVPSLAHRHRIGVGRSHHYAFNDGLATNYQIPLVVLNVRSSRDETSIASQTITPGVSNIVAMREHG